MEKETRVSRCQVKGNVTGVALADFPLTIAEALPSKIEDMEEMIVIVNYKMTP